MSSIGVFDVATSGEDEQRMQKQAMYDKVAAAIYDVREKHGEWLFGAKDLDGFNDRAKLAFTSICQTIEPHLHARTGVHRKVMKALEHEWRERQACYPGCDKDEAHAKKFHKDEGSDEKEARRRQAGDHRVEDFDGHNDNIARDPYSGSAESGSFSGNPAGRGHWDKPSPSVFENPDRAHQVLDQTHQKVDELAQHHHDTLDHAHDLVDQRGVSPQTPAWGPEADQEAILRDQTQDQGQLIDPWHQESHVRGLPYEGSRYYAEFEDQPDHPELNTHETYQPHTYEKLEPKGDFDAYKDSVDQGAESKVDHDFTAPDQRSPSPYSVERHDDDGSHNFVPTVTGARALPEYQRIAAMIQADLSAPIGAPGMGGSGAPQGATAPNGAAQVPTTAPAAPAAPADTSATGAAGGGGTTPVDPSMGGGASMTASREYQAILGMVRQAEMPGAPAPAAGGEGGSSVNTFGGIGEPSSNIGLQVGGQPHGSPTVQMQDTMGNHWGSKASKWALKQIQEVGTKEARKRLLAVCRSHGVIDDKTAARVHTLLTKRVADSNYLQKADEALTKVLNEKAEEFQNTIAPLQQALITIQQAEQIANPLNVSPPAGTVNVLPGQQQAGGAGAAMGGAGAAAMDATGGGVGMGVDPAAAGLAGQPATQAMQASRKRGGRGKGQRG